jgi:enoyl-CoA hydratase/carnithine racemase
MSEPREASTAGDYVSPTDRVKLRLDGPALHIVFDNLARHNALSVDMWGAVPPLLKQAEHDDRVRLVVFSGAGEKAFVSGADISQFEDQRAAKEAVKHYEALAEDALMSIYRFPKPTIACIRGWCIGGGVNVAISCDIRLAASDAVFSIPAARLGLGYRYSALKNLVDLIGVGPAKDLFFTARRIDAAEALRLGLVTRTASVAELPALLDEYVKSIGENAPLTVQAGKAIVGEILKPSPELDMQRCRELIIGCFESEDYAEGRRAFMEKRRPAFKGR